jgi:hypothetical protein
MSQPRLPPAVRGGDSAPWCSSDAPHGFQRGKARSESGVAAVPARDSHLERQPVARSGIPRASCMLGHTPRQSHRPHRLGEERGQLSNIYRNVSTLFVQHAIQTNSSSHPRLQTASDGHWIIYEPCLVSELCSWSCACIDLSSLRRLRLRLAKSSSCLRQRGRRGKEKRDNRNHQMPMMRREVVVLGARSHQHWSIRSLRTRRETEGEG